MRRSQWAGGYYLRLTMVISLVATYLLVPQLSSVANATVVGTSECTSDIDYPSAAETATVNGQCVIIFKGSTSAGGNRANGWTAPAGVTKIQLLLVGGGGSGGKGGNGSNEAGGGGAGELILAETSTVPGTKYSFVIGSGGDGNGTVAGAVGYGSNGNGSAAFGFTAQGGGRGGGSNGSGISNPEQGGSGGGGAHNQVTGATKLATVGKGHNGGTPGFPSSGAGGGGAGSVGETSTATGGVDPYIGGAGGKGFCSTISGTYSCYAGGGGGTGSWTNNTQVYGAGGSGVGGAGNGSAGTDSTGSGGGGQMGNQPGTGGNGGSGVLIIRWSANGYTNSLRMYAVNDAGATSSTTFSSKGRFYSSCSTTELVFPYAGDTSTAHNWGADPTTGGPQGCNSDGFTVYITGWIKAAYSSFYLYTRGDDGSRVDINGSTLVNRVGDQGPNLQPSINAGTNGISGLTVGSWYRIDAWLHENGGGAELDLLWATTSSAAPTSIPSTNMTYQFPSTIANVQTTSLFTVRESSTVTTVLDTTTAKVYNDAGTSLLSQSGFFQLVDSGTASTTCSTYSPDAVGVATCIWRPETSGTRSILIKFISTDTLGINSSQLFQSSVASTQISATSFTATVGAMYMSSDTDTAMNLTGSTQFASVVDTTTSIFDLSTAFTIQAWVNPTDCSGTTERPVVYKLNAYSLYCKSGTWWYKLAGASTSWTGVDTGVPVRVGSWQNVCIARLSASNSVSFYLDGNSETITSQLSADGAGTGQIAVNNNDFEIGAQSGVGKFLGQIDEVKVFSSYRYDNQVPGDISSYLSTSTSGLVAYYDMNESSTAFIHNRVTGSNVTQDLRVYGVPSFSTIAETTVTAGVTTVIFKRTYLTAGSGWKMPIAKSNVSVVVVGGGGGGGGGYQGGGGGAGGMLESTTSLSATYYPIKVGLGGAGRKTSCMDLPRNGETSTAFNLSAAGGGAGGVDYQCGGVSDGSTGAIAYALPKAGGSGGGGNWSTGSLSGGAGTTNQGNPGGSSLDLRNLGGYYTTTRYGGAGGGGAGAAGSAPTGTKISSPTLVAKGGNGGAGKYSEILGMYVAGGGAGSIRDADSATFKGVGGNGGGGDSGWATGMNASDGSPNTGGGGGATSGIHGGDGSGWPARAYILGLSGDGGSGVVALRWSEKSNQAPLYIGQYTAFSNISTYPLNVYGGSGTGTVTRTLVDSGTANCTIQSAMFLQAAKVGACVVSATKAGDANYFAETTTATIYWIQWSDAYSTRVATTPTEIVLNHQTQIIKYNFDTLTVTSYQDGSGNSVTQILKGSQLRIIGDGYNPSDLSTEVVFGNAELVDMNYSTPALQIVSNGSGGYYLLVTVPTGATTDYVTVNSAKGTAYGPTLTIVSP